MGDRPDPSAISKTVAPMNMEFCRVLETSLNILEILTLDYVKFGVSNLFFSRVIEEKPLGDQIDPPPPLAKVGLKLYTVISQ